MENSDLSTTPATEQIEAGAEAMWDLNQGMLGDFNPPLFDDQSENAKAEYRRTAEIVLEAALACAPSPWQSIDSAPRDGTVFLAYQASDEVNYYECWWQDDISGWSGWQDHWDTEPEPTHWQSRPTPPKEGEAP